MKLEMFLRKLIIGGISFLGPKQQKKIIPSIKKAATQTI